jgi:methionine-rich copper-binding protein CopC
MSRIHPRSALVIGLVATAVAVPSLAAAHDGPQSTNPRAASTVDGVVDHVDIDFGIDVRDPAMQIYDPTFEPLDSTTSQTGPQTVRLDFAPLSQEGEYIISYFATATDGHAFSASFGFDYVRDAGGANTGPWLVFGIAAVIILAAGTWLTLRSARRRAPATEATEATEATADASH